MPSSTSSPEWPIFFTCLRRVSSEPPLTAASQSTSSPGLRSPEPCEAGALAPRTRSEKTLCPAERTRRPASRGNHRRAEVRVPRLAEHPDLAGGVRPVGKGRGLNRNQAPDADVLERCARANGPDDPVTRGGHEGLARGILGNHDAAEGRGHRRRGERERDCCDDCDGQQKGSLHVCLVSFRPASRPETCATDRLDGSFTYVGGRAATALLLRRCIDRARPRLAEIPPSGPPVRGICWRC